MTAVEELYGTRYQSGSFSLTNVGSVFHCLRSFFFFLFMQAVNTIPLATWCAVFILGIVVAASATAAANKPLSAPFTGLLIRLLPVHMFALPVPCDVDHKQTPTPEKGSFLWNCFIRPVFLHVDRHRNNFIFLNPQWWDLWRPSHTTKPPIAVEQ